MQCISCKGYRHDGECQDSGYDDYLAAYSEYMRILALYPPAHRTLDQQKEIYRLEGICGIKRMKARVI